MMKCGHSGNATIKRGDQDVPCCAVCLGLHEGAEEIDTSPPDLTGRQAMCYGSNPKPSSSDLAFFEHCPNQTFDRYYCGCHGWD